MTVKWQNPPDRMGGRTSSWERLLEQVRERPGEWALVKHYPSPKSAYVDCSRLRRGHLNAPPGRWEFRASSDGKGAGDIYARYLGPKE